MKTTPLHSLHVELGARMTAFAGYEMPLQYKSGVLREHLHTREAAGLFDISHMGQIALCPRSGHVVDAALALERLIPSDIVSLEPGRQRYSFFTSENGGILVRSRSHPIQHATTQWAIFQPCLRCPAQQSSPSCAASACLSP